MNALFSNNQLLLQCSPSFPPILRQCYLKRNKQSFVINKNAIMTRPFSNFPKKVLQNLLRPESDISNAPVISLHPLISCKAATLFIT